MEEKQQDNMLELGSVVILKAGEQPLMVIARGSLYNNNGTIGYFDYMACPYPGGYMGGDVFFFNQEDVKEILFRGYHEKMEDQFRALYREQIKKTEYKRLHIVYGDMDQGSEIV